MSRSSSFASNVLRLVAVALFGLALAQPLIHTTHHAEGECNVCHFAREGAYGILSAREPCSPTWTVDPVHVIAARVPSDQFETRLHVPRAPPVGL